MNDLSVMFAGSWLLLGVGLYGLMLAKHLLKLMIVLQVLVKAALLALISAAYLQGQGSLGQSLALTVIVADTLAAVIGLALAVQLKARMGTLMLDEMLQGEG